MKRISLTMFFSVILFLAAHAQVKSKDFVPSGKFSAKVFWNYHYDMTVGATKTSAFEINRSYLGYKYAFSKNISAKITLDVGKNDAGSAYTAYLKAAQLDWKVASGLKLSFGLIGLKQFNDQEHFWGYRYMYKSFMDEHGFGSSADLGVNAEIKLAKKVKVNLLVINGEGYKKIQDVNGLHRVGANIVAEPAKGLILKAYYDYMPNKYTNNNNVITDTASISNLSFFAGYKLNHTFRIGAEYNVLYNGAKYTSPAQDHNQAGFSIYSTYAFSKKFEIFARYDQLASNTLQGQLSEWNYSKDGSLILAGIQYSPVKGVKTALNFRTWSYKDPAKNNNSLIYVNFEYTY